MTQWINTYSTYHTRTKMKPIDVKLSIYTDFNKAINDKDTKFKINDIVRKSKYRYIFA